MRSKRRVAVVTGSRAEFGLLEPVLRAMQRSAKLEPQLIVTGMHLLPRFGRTINQIRAAGWKIDAIVRMQDGKDDVWSEPVAAARGIDGVARSLRRLNSDIMLVLGDRIEAFAAATAGALARVPVAHIHGGDRATGQTDDALRNAITRVAHIHLVASDDARQRLRRAGESPWRIHRVGAPGLDDILPLLRGSRRHSRQQRIDSPILERQLSVLSRPYAVIVHHPVSVNAASEYQTMRSILSAVSDCGLTGVVIYPNNDPGHSGILRAIDQVRSFEAWIVISSLQRPDYLRLVSRARVLIGNSSSGIIESASLGINAVNIGPRQHGRLRCGKGVIDVDATPEGIRAGIRKALARRRPNARQSVYGTGQAGIKITSILEKLIINDRLLLKEMTY